MEDLVGISGILHCEEMTNFEACFADGLNQSEHSVLKNTFHCNGVASS